MFDWQSVVRRGQTVAGRKVPVVLFHDWGMHGMFWMKIPPSERELWMRVRGAEIYAAGGFFAFPVHGASGSDAGRDGTLREIARQTAFYAANRELYLKARPVAVDCVKGDTADLSTALWVRDSPPAVIVHAINRRTAGGAPMLRKSVKLLLPLDARPRSVTVTSPDGRGIQGEVKHDGDGLSLILSELEAYDVAVLEFDKPPVLKAR